MSHMQLVIRTGLFQGYDGYGYGSSMSDPHRTRTRGQGFAGMASPQTSRLHDTKQYKMYCFFVRLDGIFWGARWSSLLLSLYIIVGRRVHVRDMGGPPPMLGTLADRALVLAASSQMRRDSNSGSTTPPFAQDAREGACLGVLRTAHVDVVDTELGHRHSARKMHALCTWWWR
ncbi:hypothetical protein BDN70DRAFT_874499 [Pholiota conissans]|uniref:Uncharacterized protein n=1 Tax=Pholiota conissans TaxID=109636 RepID=A0A9P5Z9W5_9AGAR|nr:hypothetical protein BDN70DRAFT_874499 [Pholiota conissans]